MKHWAQKLIGRVLHAYGLEVVRYRGTDAGQEDQEIIDRVADRTMTGPVRLVALIDAVRYVVRHNVPGALAECGVWRGGSMMAVAHTLLSLGRTDRDLFLFDTFTGMPLPDAVDVNLHGQSAREKFRRVRRGEDSSDWCYASFEDVREALHGTGYPRDRIHLIQGKVEETLPASAPDRLALLRLDTDWYASTRHEMVHLYPRISAGGILLVDDYGHWRGAREAVDEYIAENDLRLFLHRVDYGARIAIKTESRG